MKKILLMGVLYVAMLSLSGCGEETNKVETKKTETPVAMKCEAGKCGKSMEKVEKNTAPAKKCEAGAKCGEGKCGSKNPTS